MTNTELKEKWGPEIVAIFERYSVGDQNKLIAELDSKYPELHKQVDAAVRDWQATIQKGLQNQEPPE